jgi:hypothetical protein
MLTYVMINDADDGSENNYGIYKLIIGAILVGSLGSFLAPRINAFFYRFTLQGRRRYLSDHQSTALKLARELQRIF